MTKTLRDEFNHEFKKYFDNTYVRSLIKEWIDRNFISKEDVREAVGKDEKVSQIRVNKEAFEIMGTITSATEGRNTFRQEIRQKLHLEEDHE